MRSMKEQIGKIFGIPISGPSAASGKRRQLTLQELLEIERPKSLVKVVGFIPSLKAQSQRRSI